MGSRLFWQRKRYHISNEPVCRQVCVFCSQLGMEAAVGINSSCFLLFCTCKHVYARVHPLISPDAVADPAKQAFLPLVPGKFGSSLARHHACMCFSLTAIPRFPISLRENIMWFYKTGLPGWKPVKKRKKSRKWSNFFCPLMTIQAVTTPTKNLSPLTVRPWHVVLLKRN